MALQCIKQLRYGVLKFKLLHTKLSYLVLVSEVRNRLVYMGLCKTSNFSTFTFIYASDLEFCTRSYSSRVYHMMKFKSLNGKVCKMMTSQLLNSTSSLNNRPLSTRDHMTAHTVVPCGSCYALESRVEQSWSYWSTCQLFALYP